MESIEIGAGMEKDGKECDYVVQLVVKSAKPKPGEADRTQEEIDFEVKKLMDFIANKVKVPVMRHDCVSKGNSIVLLKVTCAQQRLLRRAEKMKVRVLLRRDFSGNSSDLSKSSKLFVDFNVASYERNLFEPAHADNCPQMDNCSCPIFSSSQRLKIIRTLIDDGIKKYCKRRSKPLPSVDGTVEIFPLHEPTYVRMDFLRRFAGWKTMWNAYLPKQSDQFTTFIRNYFGEKIGLYFSFLHFYTRWLFLLSLFGTLTFIIQRAESTDGWWVPIYCIIVALWAAFLLEFWKRKQNAICYHWDMMDFEETERQLRSFKGVKPTAPGFYEEDGEWVDLSALESYFRQEGLTDQEIKDLLPKELKYPDEAIMQGTKTSLASTVIFLLVSGVVAVTVSILYVRLVLQSAIATYGSAIAGCINAITIAIADVIYRRVAVALNDWENYRTATQYEDRLIYKIFFFQFINSYFSLFYIAFFKSRQWPLFDRREACQPDCMTELEVQLTTLLLTRLVIGNLTEFGIPYVMKKITEASMKRGAEPTVENKVVLDIAEKEASLVPYSNNEAVSGTFDDYAELVIQFGYVTLFAPAFPLAPLIAVLSNIVETSTDAGKLLTATQRPEPRGAEDMGTFFRLFQALSYISVMTNMGIIYGTSTTLEHFIDGLFDDGLDHPITRFVVVVIIEHIILGLKLMIDDFINDRPGWLRVEIARAAMKVQLELDLKEMRQAAADDDREGPSPRASFVDTKGGDDSADY